MKRLLPILLLLFLPTAVMAEEIELRCKLEKGYVGGRTFGGTHLKTADA